MALPGHGELVSRGLAICGLCVYMLRKVIFNLSMRVGLAWGHFADSPLSCRAPCAQILRRIRRCPPRDRTLAGRPWHFHASGVQHQYQSAAAGALPGGAQPRLERQRLILQPIQPPQTLGSTSHDPNRARTLTLPHVALRRLEPPELASDATAQTALSS